MFSNKNRITIKAGFITYLMTCHSVSIRQNISYITYFRDILEKILMYFRYKGKCVNEYKLLRKQQPLEFQFNP